jgi:hypothetical protein
VRIGVQNRQSTLRHAGAGIEQTLLVESIWIVGHCGHRGPMMDLTSWSSLIDEQLRMQFSLRSHPTRPFSYSSITGSLIFLHSTAERKLQNVEAANLKFEVSDVSRSRPDLRGPSSRRL